MERREARRHAEAEVPERMIFSVERNKYRIDDKRELHRTANDGPPAK
jgi:hypothetical protein